MPIASALRFRLCLGLAKRLIFAVDSIPFRIPLPYRQTGQPRFYLAIPKVGSAVQILQESHHLAGWFAVPDHPMRAAVLLFHGIGDRIHYWRGVQQRLAESGVASLVFHYSGYPGSGGTTTPNQLCDDAHTAYNWLCAHVSRGTPVFLVGFSLGTGLATDVAAKLQPPPAGLILCEAFSTLRSAARRITRPFTFLARLLPDLWRTCDTVKSLPIPLLVVHSTGDALFPVAMAEEIYNAAAASGVMAQLQVLQRHRHNAPYLAVPEDYWQAVIGFITRVSAGRNSR